MGTECYTTVFMTRAATPPATDSTAANTPNFALREGFQGRLFALTLHGTPFRTSCHHKAEGACGACYARLSTLIDAIRVEPSRAAEFVELIEDAMRADARQPMRLADAEVSS